MGGWQHTWNFDKGLRSMLSKTGQGTEELAINSSHSCGLASPESSSKGEIGKSVSLAYQGLQGNKTLQTALANLSFKVVL